MSHFYGKNATPILYTEYCENIHASQSTLWFRATRPTHKTPNCYMVTILLCLGCFCYFPRTDSSLALPLTRRTCGRPHMDVYVLCWESLTASDERHQPPKKGSKHKYTEYVFAHDAVESTYCYVKRLPNGGWKAETYCNVLDPHGRRALSIHRGIGSGDVMSLFWPHPYIYIYMYSPTHMVIIPQWSSPRVFSATKCQDLMLTVAHNRIECYTKRWHGWTNTGRQIASSFDVERWFIKCVLSVCTSLTVAQYKLSVRWADLRGIHQLDDEKRCWDCMAITWNKKKKNNNISTGSKTCSFFF